jgi:putative phage-type endonuclease
VTERPRGIKTPTGRLILPATATHTDAWFQARASRLGGSEVAAVIGLSPWLSRFSLWHIKKGAWMQPEIDEMRWGRMLERPIIDWFAHEHPEYEVRRVGTYVEHVRDWQVCTPDALLLSSKRAVAGLEAKCDRYDDGWGEPGTDEIPVHYRCQVLWCMDITGLDRWYIAVLFGGSDYREYLIEWDNGCDDDLDLLRAAGRSFLDDVENDVLPDIDSHSATHQVIRDLHPDIEPGDVVIPDDLAAQYWRAEDVYEAAADNRRHWRSLVLNEIGSRHGAKNSAGVKVARRQASAYGAPPHLRDWRPKGAPRTRIQTEELIDA